MVAAAVSGRAPGAAPPPRAALAFPIDATLGADGLPQSGTGQSSLLTGRNAVALHGSHFGPWVPVRLRSLVEEHNVLSRALRQGRSAAFANAYPRGWPGSGRPGRRLAAPPLAARAAGLLTRHHEALSRGEAVSSEITNDGWRRHLGHVELPEITPWDAGVNLGRIANAHDLTLYAHWATDTAGHRGGMPAAIQALERVDAFLGGTLAVLAPEHLLLVVSDHGNIEDVRGGHTRHPALGLLAGPDAATRAAGIGALTDVTPAILDWLEA